MAASSNFVPAAPSGVPPAVIWCPVCQRTADDSAAAWGRYRQAGGPRCCGRPMCTYTPSSSVDELIRRWEALGRPQVVGATDNV